MINPKLQKLLCKYAKEGNLAGVKEAISQGADAEYNYFHAVFTAASNGHAHIVEFLAKKEYALSYAKEGIVGTAATTGHTEVIKSFAKIGVFNYIDGADVLLTAVSNGNIDVIKALHDVGVDFYKHGVDAMLGSLRWKSRNREENANIMKVLIECGTDKEQAFTRSVWTGNFDLFLCLLDLNFDWTISDNLAMRYGNMQFVQHLITEYGADPNIAISRTLRSDEINDWCMKYLDTKNLSDKISTDLPSSDFSKTICKL